MTQKVAVLTGITGGLGTSMADALLAQGRVLVGTYFPSDDDKARAEALQSSLKEQGHNIHIYPLDVTDFESCQAFAEKVEQEVGPVSVLVNNAGIAQDAPIRRMEQAQWQAVIDTNLNSIFNMTKAFFDRMYEREFGRIVNISSLNGEKGQFGQCNYAAAKAGIYGFTRSIALEGARKGVTVNAVSPGFINSPMLAKVPEKVMPSILSTIPMGRLGEPEDIARAVAFLAADDAAYITGTNISVNGGAYMN